MTGRELIKWILDNNAENLPIEIQYRDKGGEYNGTDIIPYLLIESAEDEYHWQYRRLVL